MLNARFVVHDFVANRYDGKPHTVLITKALLEGARRAHISCNAFLEAEKAELEKTAKEKAEIANAQQLEMDQQQAIQTLRKKNRRNSHVKTLTCILAQITCEFACVYVRNRMCIRANFACIYMRISPVNR